jgi:CheY-like chemotaxis protein
MRAQPNPSEPSAKANEPAARTLLIIEDDLAFAQILSDLGTRQQFQCTIAQRADEGIQLALARPPSAIVLDVGLPDHSGLSVLDRLKREPRTRHIPVHVVSAADYAQTAMEMGAIGYALKPVKREALEEALLKLASKAEQKIKRVLVVEDDAVQRDAVARLLQSDGVETITVSTAREALQRLNDTTLDCMVLDLSLPDASGYDLLSQMASEDSYAFPPVIVYTGHSLSRAEEEQLRRYSRSIIIKGARSPERLLDEAMLFLHQVESQLPPERKRMLKEARDRETLFEDRSILLVEDDVRNIFALSRVLEPRGAKIEIARNGREAIDRLAKEPRIDLVLMDIMMQEMDGYEAMQAIRQRPELEKLPIIALTAKAMPDDQAKCLQAGANDYVAKPIDVDKLLSLIRVWMPK